MKPEATYEPPPAHEGTVTLKMSETTAAQLRALIGKTTGGYFEDIWEALDNLPIKKLRWGVLPGYPRELHIDLNGRTLQAE